MKIKNVSYPILTLFLCSAFFAFPVMAEPGKTAPASTEPSAKKDNVDKMKDRRPDLKNELGLTDEQAAKVETIMQESRESGKKLRDDQTLSKEDRMAKMKEIREAADEKLKTILTPEQQAKHEEMKKKRMDQFKNKQAQAKPQS